MRAFIKICRVWKLNEEEQLRLLGGVSKTHYRDWRHRTGDDLELPDDVLERISCVLGIYKALNVILPEPDAADGWLRRPNEADFFNRRPAIERMLTGKLDDLYSVRQYLDSSKT